MKNRALIILAAIMLLALTACGSPKPPAEKQLQADVEAYEDYAWLEAETTGFEIIKRQTNEDAKEDLVWVCIEGENDVFTVTRSYEMRYVLYNDGWELEEIYPYYNEQTTDSMAPKSGPTEQQVQLFRPGFFSYATFDPYDYDVSDVHHTDEDLYIDEYGGYDTWYFDVVYHYDVFDEYVTVPVAYIFDTASGSWQSEVQDWLITDRSMQLNEGLIGVWEGEWMGEEYYGEILSIDETGCTFGECRMSKDVGKPWEQIDIIEGGHATLVYDPDKGPTSVFLYWDDRDGRPPVNIYDGELVWMSYWTPLHKVS